MIKHIMVCTDGSPFSDTACRYAVDISQRLKARLMGLHVLDARALEGPLLADVSNWIGAQPYGGQRLSFHKMMEDKGRAILDNFADLSRQQGIEPETIMTTGHPVAAILDAEDRAELLIVGRQGEHAGLGDESLGSSVDRLVRRSVTPCMVTPKTFKPIQRILAAYDGSGPAGRALQTAVELAQALSAELSVLTVGEDDGETRSILDEAAKRLAAYGVTTPPERQAGKPETTLIEQATKREADCIIAGTHGHGRIRERLLGGITHALLNHSPVALLMVR